MYGFIEENGNVMVEFIYEPPQQGTVDSLQLLRDKGVQLTLTVDFLEKLGLNLPLFSPP